MCSFPNKIFRINLLSVAFSASQRKISYQFITKPSNNSDMNWEETSFSLCKFYKQSTTLKSTSQFNLSHHLIFIRTSPLLKKGFQNSQVWKHWAPLIKIVVFSLLDMFSSESPSEQCTRKASTILWWKTERTMFSLFAYILWKSFGSIDK